ncbi:MAG: NAD(P)H-dependent oxidoreductase [Pseudomonadota bacterium]
MKALVVFCHPNPDSFCAHLRTQVLEGLAERGAEVRQSDLYAKGFNPVMSREERAGYHDEGDNERPVAEELSLLRWCDTLVFVYPTWWFGIPAMLKGWLDRVFVPHATFTMPTAERPIGPKLQNITTIAAITTCGARRWQLKFIGEPGRRTLLRAIRFLCHPRCKTRYAAFYKIDSSSHTARVRYAAHVRRLARTL